MDRANQLSLMPCKWCFSQTSISLNLISPHRRNLIAHSMDLCGERLVKPAGCVLATVSVTLPWSSPTQRPAVAQHWDAALKQENHWVQMGSGRILSSTNGLIPHFSCLKGSHAHAAN